MPGLFLYACLPSDARKNSAIRVALGPIVFSEASDGRLEGEATTWHAQA